MNFTEEQILALAPDEASEKSGKDSANPNKWVSQEIIELALLREAHSSGGKSYPAQGDIYNIAFKCSVSNASIYKKVPVLARVHFLNFRTIKTVFPKIFFRSLSC